MKDANSRRGKKELKAVFADDQLPGRKGSKWQANQKELEEWYQAAVQCLEKSKPTPGNGPMVHPKAVGAKVSNAPPTTA